MKITVESFKELVRENFIPEEVSFIFHALEIATKAHEGQKRDSGDDYIIHPVSVADILLKLGLDCETVTAALLHDVIEDTDYTLEFLRDEFNETIAVLVDGVTKINKLNFKSRWDEQVENLRKMLLAMAHDIRVIIIKLADRLHNMRTLSYKSEKSQIENSKETLEIFAPIAARLGMGTVKCELEDLAMKYLYPNEFAKIVQEISATKVERDKFVQETSVRLQNKLEDLGIVGEVNGRPKHVYSIFLKMQCGKSFHQIYDLIALRIIVPTVKDCYEMLGVIHTMWKPLPGRFKDYIAMPKPNLYQSLHTTVISQYGSPFEIQIRTIQMHKVAEFGIAAHWKYKEKKLTANDNADKFAWIREVLELQKDAPNSKMLLESMKMDLYPDEVFAFTPEGEVKSLRYGSTALDFAYKVHSEVGNKCTGVKINSRIMPLNTRLQTGDIVEIITSKASKGPSRDWLNFVVTPGAKNKIKAYFKKTERVDNIKLGSDMLEKECRKRNHLLKNLLKQEYIDDLCLKYAAHSMDDIYAMIGFGDLMASHVSSRLINIFHRDLNKIDGGVLLTIPDKPQDSVKKPSTDGSGIVIKGFDDLLIRISKCCNPVPGDKIVGYITRGRGICIHRADCPNVKNFEKERLIEAIWPLEQAGKNTYKSRVEIVGYNTIGLLANVTTVISNFNMQINSMNIVQVDDNVKKISIGVLIKDLDDMKKLIDKLSTIKDVIEVYRG